jgi:hypothetical protein
VNTDAHRQAKIQNADSWFFVDFGVCVPVRDWAAAETTVTALTPLTGSPFPAMGCRALEVSGFFGREWRESERMRSGFRIDLLHESAKRT